MVFLRGPEAGVLAFRKLFNKRQAANHAPHASEQKPHHALAPVAVDDALRIVMNGYPFRQCGVAARRINGCPNQHGNAQAVNNPSNPRTLNTTSAGGKVDGCCHGDVPE